MYSFAPNPKILRFQPARSPPGNSSLYYANACLTGCRRNGRKKYRASLCLLRNIGCRQILDNEFSGAHAPHIESYGCKCGPFEAHPWGSSSSNESRGYKRAMRAWGAGRQTFFSNVRKRDRCLFSRRNRVKLSGHIGTVR